MRKTFNVIAYQKGNEYESIHVSCFKQAWTSKMTEQISAIKIFKPFCGFFKVFLAEKVIYECLETSFDIEKI